MVGILFAIKEAFASFFRRWFLSILTIITVSVGLFIFGFFLVVTLNIQQWFDRVGRKIFIEVYIDDTLSEDNINQLIQSISKYEEVEDIQYISPEKAKEEFISEFDTELLSELEFNPFPPSLRIKVKSRFRDPQLIRKFVDKIKDSPVIIDLDFSSGLAQSLYKILKTFWLLVFIGALILFIGAFLIIFNTIRLGVLNRKEFVFLLDIFGAKKGFITAPFIIEGLLHGVCAGILSGAILIGIFSLMSNIFGNIIKPFELVSIFLIPLGGFLGSISSRFALSRYLRKLNPGIKK